MMPDLPHDLAADGRRTQIYLTMLAEPRRTWTASQLADVLPAIGINSLRTTLHLLLGGKLVDIVKPVGGNGGALTLQLNELGLRALETAVRSRVRSANADHGRSSEARLA